MKSADPEVISREAKARYLLSGERFRATDIFNRACRGEKFFLYYKPYRSFVEVVGAFHGTESCMTGTAHFFEWRMSNWAGKETAHAVNFDLSDEQWDKMVLNSLGTGI
jgi:hypothetical protein